MLSESIENEMRIAIEHHCAGRLGQAEQGYRHVLIDQPNHFHAVHNLGLIAYQEGEYSAAMRWLNRALEINPDSAEAWNNLAIIFRAQRKFDEAVVACKRAIYLNPPYADAFTTLGNCLSDLDRFDEAHAAYQQTVRLAPGLSTAYSNLGGILSDKGQHSEAIVAHRKAIELEPDNAGAHWNLALNLLLMGDSQGWEEYEWRWKFSRFPSQTRNFKQPLWKGESLHGRTILLHVEQGLGDTIQFVRYIPWVVARGGSVILECPEPLHRLLRSIPDIGQCVIACRPLPEFELHCPLLSLPLMLGTRFERIPPAPYLIPNPNLVAKWKRLIPPSQGRLRVGLVWAGSNTHTQDSRRSIELSRLALLGAVGNADFYTIQQGPAALSSLAGCATECAPSI